MGKKKTTSVSCESLLQVDKAEPVFSSFGLQLKLLLIKQYLIFSRNIKSTLFQIFTPVFLCIFLVCLQQLADYSMSTQIDKSPDVLNVDKIPKCYGEDCITVGIGMTAPNRTEFVNFAMEYLAKHNDLDLGKDVRIVAESYEHTIRYLDHNSNKTQTCILFCTGDFYPPKNPYYNETIPCQVTLLDKTYSYYSVLINSTLTPMLFFSGYNSPEPVDYASLAVKKNLDEALFQFVKGRNLKLSIDVQSFPSPTNRWMSGYDIVSQTGSFYFFIPPMVTFVVLLIEIVREKEHRLRFGLLLMGLKHEAYWLAWFITGLVFTLIVTNSLLISGLACVFEIFLNTPYPYFLVLFVLFSISMMHLSFVVSTTISTTKAAYTTSYAFILAGLVFQFLLSDITIIYLLYGQNVPHWVKIVRAILPLYPPFNFAKAYGDISMKAGSHYSSHEKRWVDGSEYSWNDFTKTIDAVVQGDKVKVPSTLSSYLILVGDLLLYAVLAWYLDHVLPSNRGSADGYFFFLKPRYWGCRGCMRKKSQASRLLLNTKITDPSVLVPREHLVEISGINKVFRYRKSCTRKVGRKDIHAVKDFSLTISQNELLGVLGHNGAGKSTLINIITGLTPLSSGSGQILGFDIETEMSEIRKVLGVCPQHDILWNELTAREHLVMFGMIKGSNKGKAEADADTILDKLKLTSVANKLAGTFSGGMKRRLSVGISGVGNPKLIIMDEPTTGMDPINRRCAWKLIQEMKKDRLVLLTTHSMEEADVLCDRVLVIVDGMLKCIGTSLYLKNTFGDGFRITLVTVDTERCVRILQSMFKRCKVLDISGASVLIALPFDESQEILEFFKVMENKEKNEFGNLIDDWGFSNTTLEEVFMRVTGKKITLID